MKTYKNITLKVGINQQDEFIAKVESTLPKDWFRDRDSEQRQGVDGLTTFFYFVCKKNGDREAALVALATNDDSSLYVSNIVPRELNELSYDQYNLILNQFKVYCLDPIIKELGIEIEETNEIQSIEDWISGETAKKLRKFSALANKSTGSSHPYDKDRWYDFVVSYVMNDDRLDGSSLRRWLTEEEGWSQEIAQDLVIEFEQGVGLLNYYRRK